MIMILLRKPHVKNELAALSASFTFKIEDDKIKAALRLLSSEDKPAADNDAFINALMEKHYVAAQDRRLSPSPRDFDSLQVSENTV